MKIVTWNVNGFRSVEKKGGLHELVKEHKPEFIFLQEIKCHQDDIGPINSSVDYMMYAESSRISGRHGVAMFIRKDFLEREIGENKAYIEYLGSEGAKFEIDPIIYDDASIKRAEARIQSFICAVGEKRLIFINVYSVNSRNDLSRLKARMEFDAHLKRLVARLEEEFPGFEVILVGDLNVVAGPYDYHGTDEGSVIPRRSGMTIEERNAFENLCESNDLVDTFRVLYPTERQYTWWSYMGNAYANNLGWRIDYILAKRSLLESIKYVETLSEYRESDHAPILMEIDI